MSEQVVQVDLETGVDEENSEISSVMTSMRRPRVDWPRLLTVAVLPAIILSLATLAGFFKWQYSSDRDAVVAAAEAVAAAKETTILILSYQADNAEKELNAARDYLTDSFQEDYTKLINEVVIPGAKERKISAVAQVPAAGSVSADPFHAVVLLFVDQKVTIGKDAPTNTASTVRVTLDKIRDRWLVSGFDPI